MLKALWGHSLGGSPWGAGCHGTTGMVWSRYFIRFPLMLVFVSIEIQNSKRIRQSSTRSWIYRDWNDKTGTLRTHINSKVIQPRGFGTNRFLFFFRSDGGGWCTYLRASESLFDGLGYILFNSGANEIRSHDDTDYDTPVLCKNIACHGALSVNCRSIPNESTMFKICSKNRQFESIEGGNGNGRYLHQAEEE